MKSENYRPIHQFVLKLQISVVTTTVGEYYAIMLYIIKLEQNF